MNLLIKEENLKYLTNIEYYHLNSDENIVFERYINFFRDAYTEFSQDGDAIRTLKEKVFDIKN